MRKAPQAEKGPCFLKPWDEGGRKLLVLRYQLSFHVQKGSSAQVILIYGNGQMARWMDGRYFSTSLGMRMGRQQWVSANSGKVKSDGFF